MIHAVTGLLAQKPARYEPLISPARDWLIALCAAFVLLAALGSVAAYFFFRPHSGAERIGSTAEPVSYDRERAGRIIADYRAKKARYDALSESVASGVGQGVE